MTTIIVNNNKHVSNQCTCTCIIMTPWEMQYTMWFHGVLGTIIIIQVSTIDYQLEHSSHARILERETTERGEKGDGEREIERERERERGGGGETGKHNMGGGQTW